MGKTPETPDYVQMHLRIFHIVLEARAKLLERRKAALLRGKGFGVHHREIEKLLQRAVGLLVEAARDGAISDIERGYICRKSVG